MSVSSWVRQERRDPRLEGVLHDPFGNQAGGTGGQRAVDLGGMLHVCKQRRAVD
jgi:hypothetical protein